MIAYLLMGGDCRRGGGIPIAGELYWYRSGNEIKVEIPLPEGVTEVKIYWRGGVISSAVYEIVEGIFTYTFTGESDELLVGTPHQVYMFTGRDVMIGYVMFETNVLTSGIVRGCGQYDDEWIVGGVGTPFSDWMAQSELFRYAVSYKGSIYALESVDRRRYEINERVFIAKGGKISDIVNDAYMDSACVTSVLPESSIIIPITYGG